MATESLSFDIFANDRASETFRRLGLSASNASGDVKTLGDRLDKLGTRVSTARVGLEGNKEAGADLDKLDVKLIRLGEKVANPNIDVNGKIKALAEINAVDLALDKLDAKHATATVSVHRSLLGLLGGAGEAGILGGGSAQAGGGGLAALGGAGKGIGIGALIAVAASMLPALIPTALGLLTGGGAAGGALLLGSAANKQLVALQKALASAKGPAKAPIQAQIKALQQTSGPELSIFGAFQDLGAAAKSAFAGALKAPGPGFSAGGGQAGAPSFLTSLMGILKQVAAFTKTLQPMLGDLFRASVPYLKMFVGFLEQATKTLLPVFTNMLQQMTPFLPLIGAGLMHIVDGLAGFLKAMGPQGMEASAKIFVAFSIAMEYALTGLGIAINWLVKSIPPLVHTIAKWFDWLIAFDHRWQHEMFVIFDGVRHDIAHIWDQIFQNTIGTVIRLGHNVLTQFNSLRHGIAVTFAGTRHDIASAWDTIWNNTVGRVQRGVGDVVRWFHTLPGRVIGALEGLGTALYNFGHMMFTKFWNGMKAAWNFVASWLKRIGGWIKDLKGPIGKDRNLLFDEGHAIMHGLGRGIRQGFNSYVSRQLGDVGAGVQRWAGTVRKALAMEGLSPGLLGNVLYQMQTESAGRVNAINLTDINAQMGDPSRGLMQVIGSTFQAYHWPGTSRNIYDPLANIAAALNYARHVYGPSLMSGGMGIGSGHGYAAGSWNVPFTGPATVHKGEIIVPARAAAAIRGGGGGNTYHIHINALVADRNAGRLAVEAIKQYEKGSGAGWRR